MKNIIKRQTTYLFKQKNIRKYYISHQGLELIIKLKPRSQELLKDLLALIGSSADIDSVVLEVEYHQLGFKNFRNFWGYRNELIEKRLLFYEDNKYYINPCYINYYNRRQKASFFKLFKLKRGPVVNMNPPVLKIVNSDIE